MHCNGTYFVAQLNLSCHWMCSFVLLQGRTQTEQISLHAVDTDKCREHIIHIALFRFEECLSIAIGRGPRQWICGGLRIRCYCHAWSVGGIREWFLVAPDLISCLF